MCLHIHKLAKLAEAKAGPKAPAPEAARERTPPANRVRFDDKAPDIVKYPSDRKTPSPLPSVGWDQRPGGRAPSPKDPRKERSASPAHGGVRDPLVDRSGNRGKGRGKVRGKKGKGKGRGKAKRDGAPNRQIIYKPGKDVWAQAKAQ